MSCGLSSTQMNELLVAGGSRICSLPGRHQRLLHHRLVRHDPRQTRHPGGRLGFACQPDERANQRLPGRLLHQLSALTGDASADLLLGQIGGGIHDQTFDGATTGRRWKLFRPFVQDDWRVTNQPDSEHRPGLGPGTRPIPRPRVARQTSTCADGQDFWLQEQPTCRLRHLRPQRRSGGHPDGQTALEPRIGFAWKPLGSQTTAFRAGYAIFHDSSWNQGAQGLWENPPYFAESAQLLRRSLAHSGTPPLRHPSKLRDSTLLHNPSSLHRHRPPPSREPFSPRTSTSNRAWCSSST